MDSGGAASPSSSKQTQQYQQPTTPSPTNNAPLSSFLAGIAGGSASTILLYPLDLIKVRMQVDERPRNSILNAGVGGGGGTASAHNINPPQVHGAAGTPRTICTTVRGVIRHEGYLGLYRGLSPAIIGSAASWGGFFILYEDFKGRMMSRKQAESARHSSIAARTVGGKQHHVVESQQQAAKLGPIEHFTASCLAGACMVALTNPLWLIKTRLQLQNSRLQNQLSQPQTTTKSTQRVRPPYRGLFHAAYIIGQEEGMLAFYKGSIPALMLVSHGGIQFMAYEFMKGHFTIYASNGKKNGDNQWKKGTDRSKGTIRERLRDSLGYLVMGAMSKFVASTATYPLQVMKARLQQRSQVIEVSEITGEIIVTKREYSGVIDCAKKIWRNEGIYGFFKGCVTNAIRVAPSAAVTFVTYEFVLDTLTDIN